MTDSALVPIEQKTVLFYEDEITAVRLADGDVLIPIRPICENMGLSWSAQFERINRDAVLADLAAIVRVTRTEGGARELLCLPLRFLPGWLFGVNASRVKPEIRERLITYQRECYDVLAEAFTEGRLTADPTFDDLLLSDSPAVMAYRMAQALQIMARQQILLEARVDDHETRLEAVEATLGDPDRHITPAQASRISQAVKAIALLLGKTTGRNEYGAIYGEMYRRFEIASYRELPAGKYDDAMSWLNEWLQSLGGEVPF